MSLELLDYRRQVFNMYRSIREKGTDHPSAFAEFQRTRNHLLANHSQSPLNDDQKESFSKLSYFTYDIGCRLYAELKTDVETISYTADLGDQGKIELRSIGQITLELPGGTGSLYVFWIQTYGGGIFLPFKDTTNNDTTYAGGRYLLDTIKGADTGIENGKLILDFNYAYHPSCHYNARWVCPLAPPQNRLDFPIEAGEKLFPNPA